MPPTPSNTRGITLMVASMALFAIADLIIKIATDVLAHPQIVFVLGIGGTVIFAGLALLRGERLFPPEAAHPAVLGRNLAEIVGAASMVMALATTPLTIVGAILQASPLTVMAGAALFLGEPVGWRRWSAALVGFLGVLIVLQPWDEGIAPGAALAVLAMICLSTRDLLNRQAPKSLPTLVLAAHGLASILTLGVVWSLVGEGALLPPDPPWALLAFLVVSATGAYFTITAAVRAAPVSVVAPFRYSRLLFLAGLGIVVLGERPTWSLAVGAALIIGSGLYALARERRAEVSP